MLRKAPFSEQYRGRWRDILGGLGVPAAALVNRHGPCPVCGGKDRFRFDDLAGKGTFICSQCGAGDGPRLAMLFTGMDFKALAAKLEGGDVGSVASRPVARPIGPVRRAGGQGRLRSLWEQSNDLARDDPVSRYLFARLGRIPSDTGLRFLRSCQHPDGNSFPVMLAAYRGPDGRATGLHRTYLSGDDRKASVSNPKLSLGELVAGGAVRLGAPGPVLGIAEGIETALAASILFGIPVWAALNANRLAVWEPPTDVREVVIFGDNDENFVGQTAAFDLDARLQGKVDVSIETPIDAGTDWCTVLTEKSGSSPSLLRPLPR